MPELGAAEAAAPGLPGSPGPSVCHLDGTILYHSFHGGFSECHASSRTILSRSVSRYCQ
jgi:hypothetical protein